MAFSKRHTRLIVIEGLRFRWRCEINCPLERFSVAYVEGLITEPDLLLVRPESAPHKLLKVRWPACSGVVVKPGVVKRYIQEGIQQGWPSEHSALELKGAKEHCTFE